MATRKYRRTRAYYYTGASRHPVRVQIPSKPLIVNGAVIDALKGESGSTIGCALSNTLFRELKDASGLTLVAFPQVTSRTMLLPTKLDKNGNVCEGTIYEHNYRRITDANDAGTLKKLVKEQPRMMERSFTFYPPARETTRNESNRNIGLRSKRGPSPRKGKTGYVSGSLLRAEKAKLVSKAYAKVARQIHPEIS